MSYSAFVWAQDAHANVKEPMETLKQNGWRYGDVPAASNFNWLFKKMTEDINNLNHEVAKLNHTLTQDIAKLKDKSDILRRSTKVLEVYVNRSLRHNRFNEGIAQQICDFLKKQEEQLKVFHPTYQPLPWPTSKPEPHQDELSDIFDDIDKAENIVAKLEEEEGTS
jgi:hypothetical protein